MSIRGLILSVASESGLSLDEAADSLHEQIDNVVSAYKHECETYAAACDAVIADSPAVTKEALAPMVAMNSIPQHEVANGKGHRELARANPTALSNDVAKNPAPS